MRQFRIALAAAVFLTVLPSALAADFGVRVGRYNDAEEEFVGAEVLFDLGAINLNPNIEYSLADDITAGTANFDVTFDVLGGARVNPYLGAGLGLAYVDDDFGDNETDLVGNLIGGLAFNLDFLKPYGQVKYTRQLEDDDGGDAEDDIALVIGLRF
jgi:hypothetical protein